MARDLPDWGALTAQATVYEITDLGELAARLGSIVTFDRRGDVVWLDEFECGLGKWKEALSGSDGSVALNTDRARNGETSVLLTTDSDGTHFASMNHLNPLPVVSKVGFEASFSIGTDIQYLDLIIDTYDVDDHYQYYIRWYGDTEELYYIDSNEDPALIATGVTMHQSVTLFHTLKLVCDMVAHEYVRLLFNSVSYSLKGIGGWRVGVGGAVRIMLTITAWGHHGDNDLVYVDDPILTQNEPAEP